MTRERLRQLANRSLTWARHLFPGSHPAPGQEQEPLATGIPLRNGRYVVFDTELTGLSLRRDSVVSLGAVVIEEGRISLGESFYRVVSPHTALSGKSVIIHGITPGEASICPGIEELLPEFLEFCRNGILVGHFVGIDVSFLDKELRRCNGGTLQLPAIDTHKVDSWMRQRLENACAFHETTAYDATLGALAGRYDIRVKNSHNALDDAYVTAQVWQRFLHELPLLGVERVQDVLAIAGV